MPAPATLVRTSFSNREIPEILRQPATVLLGVDAPAAAALANLDIASVFDLATSGVFANAAALVRAASDPRDPFARHGQAPADVLDASAVNITLDQLPGSPPTVL